MPEVGQEKRTGLRRWDTAQIDSSMLERLSGVIQRIEEKKKAQEKVKKAPEFKIEHGIGDAIYSVLDKAFSPAAEGLRSLHGAHEDIRGGLRHLVGLDSSGEESVIYKKGKDGQLELIGAVPKERMSYAELRKLYPRSSFVIKDNKRGGSAVGQIAEGAISQALAGASTAINLMPAMIGVNAVQDAVVDFAGEHFGDTGRAIASKALPFLFGSKVGVASLLSGEAVDLLESSGLLDSLTPKHKEMAKEIASHASFLAGLTLAGKGEDMFKRWKTGGLKAVKKGKLPKSTDKPGTWMPRRKVKFKNMPEGVAVLHPQKAGDNYIVTFEVNGKIARRKAKTPEEAQLLIDREAKRRARMEKKKANVVKKFGVYYKEGNSKIPAENTKYAIVEAPNIKEAYKKILAEGEGKRTIPDEFKSLAEEITRKEFIEALEIVKKGIEKKGLEAAGTLGSNFGSLFTGVATPGMKEALAKIGRYTFQRTKGGLNDFTEKFKNVLKEAGLADVTNKDIKSFYYQLYSADRAEPIASKQLREHEVAITPFISQEQFKKMTEFYKEASEKNPKLKKFFAEDRKFLTEINKLAESAQAALNSGDKSTAEAKWGEIQQMGARKLKKDFADVSELIVKDIDPTRGRFFGEEEPSLRVKVQSQEGHEYKLYRRIVDVADKWGQDAVHILGERRKVNTEKDLADIGYIKDGVALQPEVVFKFDKPVEGELFSKVTDILAEHDLAGATLEGGGRVLSTYQISLEQKGSKKFEEFKNNVDGVVAEIQEAARNSGRSMEEATVYAREVANFTRGKYRSSDPSTGNFYGSTGTYENIRNKIPRHELKEFVSKESVKEAKAVIRKSLGRMYSVAGGLPPELLKAYVTLGASHLEKIYRRLITRRARDYTTQRKEWEKFMVSQYGERIAPHLNQIWGEIDKSRITFPQPQGEGKIQTKGYNPSHVPKEHQEQYKKLMETPLVTALRNAQKGGSLTNRQTLHEAIKFAASLKDSDVLGLKRSDTKNAVESNGYSIYALSKWIDAEKAVEEGRARGAKAKEMFGLNRRLREAVQMIINSNALFSEAGRTLQSKNISLNLDVMKLFKKELERVKSIDKEWARKLEEVLEGVQKEHTPIDYLLYIYYNSILSHPFTEVANILGNTGHLGWEVGTRLIFQSPAESRAMLRGFRKGLIEGVRDAKKIYKGDMEYQSKFFEYTGGKKPVDLPTKTRAQRFARALMPTTRLGIEDAFFRAVAKNMELEVAKRQLGAKFKETIEQVETNIERVLAGEFFGEGATGEKMRVYRDYLKAVDKYSDYLVFQTPLKSVLGRALQNPVSVEGRATLLTFGAKIVVPFTKTPANIFKAGADNSLLSLAKGETWKVIAGKADKELTPLERKHVIRRMMAGSILLSWLASEALPDDGRLLITGSGVDESGGRALWQAEGLKPNHIYWRTDDGRWVGGSYQNIQPLNIGLSLIGNLSDNLKYNGKFTGEKSLPQKIGYTLLGMAASMGDQTFLSGIRELVSALTYKNEGIIEGQLARMATPGIVAFPADVKDYIAGKRTSFNADGFWEMMKRRIRLGAEKDLTKRYDIFGNVAQIGYERFPFPLSSTKNNKIVKLLKEKQVSVGLPSKTQHLGQEKMTAKEFETFARVSGRLFYRYLVRDYSIIKGLDSEHANNFVRKLRDNARKMTKAAMMRQKQQRRK